MRFANDDAAHISTYLWKELFSFFRTTFPWKMYTYIMCHAVTTSTELIYGNANETH